MKKCQGKLSTAYARCSREGVIERDGVWYCKQHDPVAARERAEARFKALRARWTIEAEIENHERACNRAGNEIVRIVCAHFASDPLLAEVVTRFNAELVLAEDARKRLHEAG